MDRSNDRGAGVQWPWTSSPDEIRRLDEFSARECVATTSAPETIEERSRRLLLKAGWRPRPAATVDSAKPASAHVYFLRAGRADRGGAIKIGFSTDVRGRWKAHQVSSPQKLTIVATMPGTMEDEAALHKRFAALRIRGEWFKAESELLAFIDSIGGRGTEPPTDLAALRKHLRRRAKWSKP